MVESMHTCIYMWSLFAFVNSYVTAGAEYSYNKTLLINMHIRHEIMLYNHLHVTNSQSKGDNNIIITIIFL